MSLLTLFLIHLGQAQPLELPQYLEQYLDQSHNLKASRANWENQRAQADQASSLMTTTLEATPQLKWQGDLEKKAVWKAGIKQGTPTGTSLSASHSQDKLLDTTRTEVTLSQSLWQNFLGKADRYGAQGSELLAEGAELRFRLARLEGCEQGALLYGEAFLQDERLKLFEVQAEEAQKLAVITKRAYGRRLVPKIDFISSQTDELRTQEKLGLGQRDRELAWINLRRDLEIQVQTLQDPDPLVRGWRGLLNGAPAGSLRVAALNKEKQGQQALWDSKRWEQRSTVNLDVVGASDTALNSVSGVRERENSLALGLTLSIPVWDGRLDAGTRSAHAQFLAKEHEWMQAQRELMASMKSLDEELKELEYRLELTHKRVKLQEEQTRLAKARVSRGKIEFEDYVRFRDREFSERLSLIDLKRTYWKKILEGLKLRGALPKECGGNT